MPRYEAKVYKFMCDICRAWSAPVVDTTIPQMPDGWGARTLRDCGMTGYTRRETLCPECFAKHGDPVSAPRRTHTSGDAA